MTASPRVLEAADGTRIRYAVQGEGPAVVLSNGLTTTVTFWKYLLPQLAAQHRVLTWDMPGHGESDPARSDALVQVPVLADLMAQLMDAAQMPDAVHVGWSTGCQLVFEFSRRHPERCRGLAALLGPAGHALSTTRLPVTGDVLELLLRHTPDVALGPIFALVSGVANAPGGQWLARVSGLVGDTARSDDVREVTAHLRRIDPATVRKLSLALQAHSAWDQLARLRMPLLIVAGDADPFAPSQEVGLPMHAAAPHSELLRLPGGTHTALLDQAGPIGEALDAFLRRTQ